MIASVEVQQHGKGQRTYQAKGCPQVPASGYFALPRQESEVATTLPFSANGVGSGARVRANQVTRSYRASDISRFGQMFALEFAGSQTTVPSGSGRRPGLNLELTGINGEPPLSVDSFDALPGQTKFLNRIDYFDTRVVHRDFWSNQQNVKQQTDKDCGGCGLSEGPQTLRHANHASARSKHQPHTPTEHLGEFRFENDGLHAINLDTLGRND